MSSTIAFDPKQASMLRDVWHEPTPNEQEVARVRRAQHRPWYNAVVTSILRSPLHPLLSRWVMLITFTGRKSELSFTTPVNYVAVRGTLLYTLSRRERKWWRNLEGGAPVTVRVRGRDCRGLAHTIQDPAAVASELNALLARVPGYAARLGIGWTDDGVLNPADLQRAAERNVVICVPLD